MPPHAILLAGANGSGKTTFARQLLSLQNPAAQFLNADEIQREAKRFSHPVAAGRELLHRLAALEASRLSFAIETTLASNIYARRIRTWSSHGYVITLHFIELPSADYAVERVRRRVAAGGRTCDAGLSAVCGFSARCTDLASISGIIGSAMKVDYDSLTAEDVSDAHLDVLLEAARRANWDAQHGPAHLRSGRFEPRTSATEEASERGPSGVSPSFARS